jgi:hypothetical protein
MNFRSQIDFDYLHQLQVLESLEEYTDISWECCKEIEYIQEEGVIKSTNPDYLVKWNDFMKSESLMESCTYI